MDEWRERLSKALVAAQRIGAVGGGDLDAHLDHSLAFARLIDEATTRAMDLGTGGGLPGLALAGFRPEIEWVLVDASARRVRVVEATIRELGWAERVVVVHGRAEALGSSAEWRGTCEVVTARSFGPAAVVAECARPFLTDAGALIVAEPPPESENLQERWPSDGLTALGYTLGRRVTGPAMQELVAAGAIPDGLPRRVGVATKRPTW